jgi:hypothetical protein
MWQHEPSIRDFDPSSWLFNETYSADRYTALPASI